MTLFSLNPEKKKHVKEIGPNGVEARFVKSVKAHGGLAYKFTSEMNRGVSDRIVILPGQVWFVEIKRENGKLTPLQKAFQQQMARYGLNHFVVFGLNGINDFWKEIKRRLND